ncbi:leucine zipper protein 2-like [Leucoraja erinacea]|uniref:leucine zipper protein 2-like n=1 Tax=Leucoraja erinaceus TaxID=7782 RepID=UPI002456EA11|nr:leucine zipper protein 2-like [Leucoraja erinacea]
MNLPCLCYILSSLFAAALAASSRRGYDDLERKLKKISTEKSSFLQQLSKSTPDRQGMKGSLQSLKTDGTVTKNDVQELLEISQKQKDEMKSLQEALEKEINEATLKAEKQQAGINFLKSEVERKSKLIKDLQQENKSLKNKLLSGNKQCGIHAEESKRIQSQLKELRYGKKDLIFKLLVSGFMNLVESFNLPLLTTGPTHKLGHTLDLVPLSGLPTCNTDIIDACVSDHSAIIFDISLPFSPSKSHLPARNSHYVNSTTASKFSEALIAAPDICTIDGASPPSQY